MQLQKFTKLQKSLVILNLIELVPHREIARYLQKLYPGVKPDGMTQEKYEEIVIKRCKDYVSNKQRKPYHKIKKGRDARRDKCIEYIVLELDDLICRLGLIPKDRKKEIEFAQVIPLVETTAQLSKDIYNLIYGKVKDETDDDDDDIEDDRPFWEVWNDTEWQEILQKRKENGNHEASAPIAEDLESRSTAPASGLALLYEQRQRGKFRAIPDAVDPRGVYIRLSSCLQGRNAVVDVLLLRFDMRLFRCLFRCDEI